MVKYSCIGLLLILLVILASLVPSYSLDGEKERIIDKKVEKFLKKMRHQWQDFNVPERDGKILYDIIVQNKYKKALEIGTSTGHSAIWLAWALSKTGGKLITIEIDERRYNRALTNFKEAGLNEYIEARLANAHHLINELPGPFDFVFIDADKDWYTSYAKAVIPKIMLGGCLTAHNVYEAGVASGGQFHMEGTDQYYEYMKSLPEFETGIHPDSQASIAVSYKKKAEIKSH